MGTGRTDEFRKDAVRIALTSGLSRRQVANDLGVGLWVISPFLTGCIRRTYAAIFSFMAGVMPPMPMLGRSLL
jgi:hypothetical protein